MKFRIRKKKSGKAPLSAGLAVSVGSMFLSWGYRKWSRWKALKTSRTTPGAASTPTTPAS